MMTRRSAMFLVQNSFCVDSRFVLSYFSHILYAKINPLLIDWMPKAYRGKYGKKNRFDHYEHLNIFSQKCEG